MSLLEEAKITPVKSTFAIGGVFLQRNLKASLPLFLLMYAAQLGSAGTALIFPVALVVNIIGIAVSIYVARTFAEAPSLADFRTRAEATTAARLAFGHIGIAGAIYLALIVAMFLFLLAASIVSSLIIDPSTIDSEQLKALFAIDMNTLGDDAAMQRIVNGLDPVLIQNLLIASLPLLVFLTLFLYLILPAQGRAYLAPSFGQAFDRIFSVFSPKLWRASLRKPYASYLFFFGLAYTGYAIALVTIYGIESTLFAGLPWPADHYPVTAFGNFFAYYFLGVAVIIAKEAAIPSEEEAADQQP